MLLEIYSTFKTWFWNEDFWLPGNVTWADLENKDRDRNDLYPVTSDIIHYPLFLALVLVLIRRILESFVFAPIGLKNGLKKKVILEPSGRPNLILENAYRTMISQSQNQIDGLSKQLDWSVREVERWLRKRTKQDKSCKLNKFTEACWNFTLYSVAFVFGLSSLWNKPWLWDTKKFWIDHPHRATVDIWGYFIFQTAIIWSMIFDLFIDKNRKEFRLYLVHHINHLVLITFSWACNIIRAGSVILFLHDTTHILLEASKTLKCLKLQVGAQVLFIAFTAVWIVTRCWIFPFRIVYSSLFESLRVYGTFPAYYLFNGMMLMVVFMNLLWSYAIIKILVNAYLLHKIEKVMTSESEDPKTD